MINCCIARKKAREAAEKRELGMDIDGGESSGKYVCVYTCMYNTLRCKYTAAMKLYMQTSRLKGVTVLESSNNYENRLTTFFFIFLFYRFNNG